MTSYNLSDNIPLMKRSEQPERNEALYNDWKSGEMKMWELVAKYHISATRIYFIVNRMESEKYERR